MPENQNPEQIARDNIDDLLKQGNTKGGRVTDRAPTKTRRAKGTP